MDPFMVQPDALLGVKDIHVYHINYVIYALIPYLGYSDQSACSIRVMLFPCR